MVRTPKDLDEAKQIFREEKGKLTSALSAIAGSRWLLAILATFTLAFGSHALYARDRLPTLEGFSLAAAGLPPSLDWGFAGEQARAAQQQAREEDVRGQLREEIALRQQENPDTIFRLNVIGFGLGLVLLLANMTIMTRRRRVTRG